MIRYLKRRSIAFSIVLLALLLIATAKLSQPDHSNAQVASPNSSFLALHHVTLSANDVDQVARWYADYLGFTISDRFTLTRPDGRQIDIARVEIPGLRMNISRFDGSVTPDRTSENQGWRHLAFEVNDVDQTYQQLRARGVQFISEPFTYDPPGYRIVFFRDPEENILELYQDL